MKRREILALSFCALTVLLIFAFLYGNSYFVEEIYRGNFERKFCDEGILMESSILDLKSPSCYISGITTSKIYLTDSHRPFRILTTDFDLKTLESIGLNLLGVDSIIEPIKFRTKIDSPYFYVLNGIMPIFLRGRLGDWRAERFFDGQIYFVDAVPTSPTTFALKSYSDYNGSLNLARLSTLDTPAFKFNFDVLQRQVDGFFCVNGNLLYDKEYSKIVYLYAYRNQFCVADTNMTLLYRGNTLDTFRIANVKVKRTSTSIESASPPSQVNGLSCVSGNRLYNQSRILGKDDFEDKFRNATTIDVYDLSSGSYVNSFYIPKFKKREVTDFLVYKRYLVAIYNEYLVLYRFNADLIGVDSNNI